MCARCCDSSSSVEVIVFYALARAGCIMAILRKYEPLPHLLTLSLSLLLYTENM